MSAQGYSGWDTYLDTLGLNVHEDFNTVYNAINRSSLDAVNVFRSTQIDLGVFALTGSGAGTFTDGDALGTGSGKFSATNSAGAQMQAYVGSGSLTVDMIMDLSVTYEDGTTASGVTATLSSGAVVGSTTNFGTSSDDIIDVTGAVFAGGTNGVSVGIR